MLTCNDLRERIPAIEAGEPATGEERDHLAACAGCRTEAARARADLERIRGDLASLAPSPFLEDAVRDIAVDTAPVTRATSRAPFWMAAAAAVVVLGIALVLASRPRAAEVEPEAGIGADDGHVGKDGGKDDGDRDASGPPPASAVFVPPTPLEAVQQRGVHTPAGEPAQIRTLQIGARPQDGYAVLGRGLLALVAGKGPGETATDAEIEFAARVLTDGGTEPVVDLEVTDPAGTARGLVRARVDRSYTGTLLLEEPFGRALGLHAWERPGHVTIGGAAGIGAQRTQAAVTLHVGSRRIDYTGEVEMRRAGDPQPATPLPSPGIAEGPRLVLVGERPDMGLVGADIGVHHMHGRIFVSAEHNVALREEQAMPLTIPLEMGRRVDVALEYRKGDHELCYVGLPSLDVGQGGPRGWQMALERVTLEGAFEPGAEIAVARVWRGHAAVPTRESAAFTLADGEGRVSYVRVRGEEGPVRVRERRKDGSVRWHRVLVQRPRATSGAVLRAGIDGHGTIRIGDGAFHLERDVHATGPTHRWTEGGAREALIARLKQAADGAGRDEDGTAQLRLDLVPQDNTPWPAVTQLLMACAHPTVRIDRIRFLRANGGGTIDYELPRDRGLLPARDPAAAKPRTMTIVLRREEARTHYILRDDGSEAHAAPLQGPGRKELAHRIRAFRKAAQDGGRPMRIELAPHSDVPYDDVRDVMAMLGAAGLAQGIRLTSSPR